MEKYIPRGIAKFIAAIYPNTTENWPFSNEYYSAAIDFSLINRNLATRSGGMFICESGMVAQSERVAVRTLPVLGVVEPPFGGMKSAYPWRPMNARKWALHGFLPT